MRVAVGQIVQFRGVRPGQQKIEWLTGKVVNTFGIHSDPMAMIKTEYGNWTKYMRDLSPADAVTRLGKLAHEPDVDA